MKKPLIIYLLKQSYIRRAVLAGAVFINLSCNVVAADRTWNGGSSTVWDDFGNWDTLPIANDTLVFAGTTGLSNSNNFTVNTAFTGITFDATAGAFTLTGNQIHFEVGNTITNNSSNLQTIGLDIRLIASTSNSVTINTGSDSLTMNGAFTAGTTANSVYTVVKTGAGVLTLTNNSSATFTGVIVNAGTLKLGNSNVVGGILAVNTANGLTFEQGITNFTVGNLGGNAQISLTDTNGDAVNLTLNRAASSPVQSGKITGTGSLIINKVTNNGGTYLSNATNDYSGGTQILVGKLAARGDGTSLGTGKVSVGAAGVLQIGGNVTINALGGVSGAIIEAENGVVTRTLTVNTTTTNNLYEGVLKDGATAGNLLAFTKLGTGTIELTGDNTYTGSTTVSDGLLLVNGTHTGAGAYSIQGTLGGEGAITTANANVTLAAGGKLSPGNSSGGELTFALGSGVLDISAGVAAANSQALIFELGTISDTITLTTGTLNIGVLNFDDFNFQTITGFAPNTYTLFSTNHVIIGALGDSITGLIGGYNATLAFANGSQNLILTIVPEPSVAILFLTSGAFLMLIRRRRMS